MIIRGDVCRNGQLRLLFVQQHLKDDVFVLRVLTVENKLDIAGHGEHQTGPPPVGLQLLKVVGHEIKSVESKKADERQDNRFVPEAKMGTATVGADDAVGVFNHLAQQFALRIMLVS